MRFDRQVDAQWGITIVRVMMGIILVVAGLTKWLPGIGGTVAFFTQLGVPVPQVIGPVIATGEFVGGLLLIAGFGSRVVALWFVCEFVVTAFYVKLGRGAGWDPARIDLMLLVGNVLLLLSGGGKLALDEWMARRGERTGATANVQVAARRH